MDRRRRSATLKKPTGPEISAAKCAELCRKIIEDPSRRISRADGAKRVQAFFAYGALDDGILSVPFKQLSLLCPIMSKRIVDPSRGVNCTHLECFDLSAYLDLQVKKPFWGCPICQKQLPAEDLRMDEFTLYALRVELDSVLSVEVFADGSHRAVKPTERITAKRKRTSPEVESAADPITLNDEPMITDNEVESAPESDPIIMLPLSVLVDFGRRTKDLLSRLPIRKGKRKVDDPADLLEELHDSMKSLIKEVRSQVNVTDTCDAAMRSPSPHPVQSQQFVTENGAIRAQNEELAGRNSALLADIVRLNRRIAELEQDRINGRPQRRFIAGTRKNATEVLMWLDRFSLDAVQLTSTLLNVLADMPMAPLRVLRSASFIGSTTSLFAGCHGQPVTKKFRGDLENVFRRTFALCSGCAIEKFLISDYEVRDVLVSMAGWTPIVRDIFANNLATIPVRTALFHCSTAKSNALIKKMKGLESVYIGKPGQSVTDKTMEMCAERGVARLGIFIGDRVTDDGLLEFCFSKAPINGDGEGRLLIMNFHRQAETTLSKEFFAKLMKKCLAQSPKALPSVTLWDLSLSAVDTTAYDELAKTHGSGYTKCTHFQFETSGEKFEVVVCKGEPTSSIAEKDEADKNEDFVGCDDDECHLIVRKGHADFGRCPPPRRLCDWQRELF